MVKMVKGMVKMTSIVQFGQRKNRLLHVSTHTSPADILPS